MRAPLCKEFALAAACALWPADDHRATAIRRAAATPIDWEGFLRVVHRHRVAGLAYHGLRQATIAVPPTIADALGRAAAKIARDNLAATAESVALQRVFDDAGITVVFFRGVTLAQLAFGDLGLRHSRDIDLLVCPHEIEPAMALIEGLGYRRLRPSPTVDSHLLDQWIRSRKECEYRHPGKRLHLELHWRLCDNPQLLPQVPTMGAWDMVPVFASHALRTLGADDLFPYLCAHGAVHSWFRLKWLADIGALLAATPPAQIEPLYLAAERQGAGRCAGLALLLCSRLFATPVPPALTAAFARERRIAWLAALALNAMTSGNAETELDDRRFGVTVVNFSRYLLRGGTRYWSAELRSQFTSFDDVALVPLPRRLRFLYPFLRLPLWCWRVMRRGRRSLPV